VIDTEATLLEIKNRLKIIQELKPARTPEEQARNEGEMHALAMAIKDWAEGFTVGFESYEDAQTMYELDSDERAQLDNVKMKAAAIAVLFES
jgi:hypothetical protein